MCFAGPPTFSLAIARSTLTDARGTADSGFMSARRHVDGQPSSSCSQTHGRMLRLRLRNASAEDDCASRPLACFPGT